MLPDTERTTQTIYKVTGPNGESCHGGSMGWALPTQHDDGSWTPGEWMSVTGDLILCQNALHLTDQPAAWYQEGTVCWRAEYRGETVGELTGDSESKIGVREARLLAPVEWDSVGVWTTGKHTLRTGVGRASGSTTVGAYGSTTVYASDSATVDAYGSTTVDASGSAMVYAYGSATVYASGSAMVDAYDSATVHASDSATVHASGSATVDAYDSATVHAYGSATVISMPWHSNSAQVALSQMAVHVDRRGSTVVCRTAKVVS